MAGFFGFFDYTRPGPGVPKNQPPKPRIVVFFGVLKRKFWNLMRINLMYSLFNIPALVLLFFATQFMFPRLLFNDIEVDIYLRLMVGGIFAGLPIICFGPAQAGMTYLLRNYAREEHAFIWGDFKEHGLKNLKESLLICAIDFITVVLLSIALNFYGQLMNQHIWAIITFGVIMLAFITFAMMHLYIYPMLVTFKITVKQIYKNALIFSTIKFLPNLGILLLCAAIIFVTFISSFIGVILFFLITNALIGLIVNFYAYPLLKKHMIDRLDELAATDNPAAQAETNNEGVFSDSIPERNGKAVQTGSAILPPNSPLSPIPTASEPANNE